MQIHLPAQAMYDIAVSLRECIKVVNSRGETDTDDSVLSSVLNERQYHLNINT